MPCSVSVVMRTTLTSLLPRWAYSTSQMAAKMPSGVEIASEKAVISVGHFMERKGILDFIQLARSLPQVRFFWFGHTDPALVPREIRQAMAAAPANLEFPGFLSQSELRDAYCGADAFLFCSHEETEGIVVLEALACGTPTLLRDIPVYDGWLTDGVNVYKGRTNADLQTKLTGLLEGTLPDVTAAGRQVAEARSLPNIGRALQKIYAALPARQKRLHPALRLRRSAV
jgi:1,2-diacylglycerol-3-alpha-glucose alpha-1,2-glucosyltransferase